MLLSLLLVVSIRVRLPQQIDPRRFARLSSALKAM